MSAFSPTLARGCLAAALIVGFQSATSAAPALRPLQIEDAVIAREFQVQGVPAQFSPDGQWVSTTVCDPTKVSVKADGDESIATKGAAYRSMGCDIWLDPAAGGPARNLTAGGGNNWGPSWSPDGKSLAFYSDRDGHPGLWVWDRAGDKFRKVTDAVTHHRLGYEAPMWLPDSRSVVVKLRPANAKDTPEDANAVGQTVVDDKEPGSTVAVFRSPRPAPKKEEGNKPPPPNAMLADIALVDVASGSVRHLLDGVVSMTYRPSPNGQYLLIMNSIPNHPDHAQRFSVVDIASAKVLATIEPIVQSFSGAVTWSPDSSRFAYVSVNVEARKAQSAAAKATSVSPPDGGDLFVADPRTGATTKIDGAPVNVFNSDYLGPLWDAQGKTLYLLDEDKQVWKADVGARRAQPLTKDGDRTKHIIVASFAGNTIGSADGALLVTTRNKQNFKGGFARVDTGTGQVTALREEDRSIANIFFPPALSPDGKQLAYLTESGQDSNDVWIADAQLRKSRRLTTINPQLTQYTFGRSQVIDFTSSDGEPLKASILLPANYKPGQRYPTVLWVYASQTDTSRFANSFGLVPMQAFNMHMFTTRGYAVMWPDIPTHKGTPIKDMMKAVMPAIDKMVELGITDPNKLAVMGNSNGGYSTLSLITQTKRFKAAVMNSGFGDMAGFYGTMGGGWIPWLERLGGSMGVPPWEAPTQYVENSPLYYLDRIETPLIIQAGAADLGIIQHSDAVWVGMQRLNKDVTYLRYGGEGHVLAAAANLKDYWKRVFAFFEQHMK